MARNAVSGPDRDSVASSSRVRCHLLTRSVFCDHAVTDLGTARETAIDCFDNPDGNRYHDLLIGSIPDQVYSAASMLGSAMAPVKF
jgi:hypothetical protein